MSLDLTSITKVSIGSDLVGALERNEADIVLVAAQHSILIAQQKGLRVKTFSTEAAGIPSFGHNILVTQGKTVKQNPEIVQRIVKAIAQGTYHVVNDMNYACTLASKHIDFPQNNGNVFLEKTLPILTTNLKQPPTLWQRVQDWMYQSNLLTKTIISANLFTNEFAINLC